MGVARTRIDVVFDTGSDWLVLHGSKCYTCDGDKFDAENSGERVSSNTIERIY